MEETEKPVVLLVKLYGNRDDEVKQAFTEAGYAVVTANTVSGLRKLLTQHEGRIAGAVIGSLMERVGEPGNCVAMARQIQEANAEIPTMLWHLGSSQTVVSEFSMLMGKEQASLHETTWQTFPDKAVQNTLNTFAAHRSQLPQGQQTAAQQRDASSPG